MMLTSDFLQNLKLYAIYSSCNRKCSIRKGALRNFAKFTGKHLCQSLCFNKVADLRATAFEFKLRYLSLYCSLIISLTCFNVKYS